MEAWLDANGDERGLDRCAACSLRLAFYFLEPAVVATVMNRKDRKIVRWMGERWKMRCAAAWVTEGGRVCAWTLRVLGMNWYTRGGPSGRELGTPLKVA